MTAGSAAGLSVLVVGGGAIGLASAWALARRGADVTVLERHTHVHDKGSHGGFTRVTRQAYHEGSYYIELVREAEREWEAMEARMHAPGRLLVRAGLLEFGPPDNADMKAVIDACVSSGLEHELLDAAASRARFPVFQVPRDWIACHTPTGGYVRVRECMGAMKAEAAARGAKFRYHAHVREIVMGQDRPRVLLNSGELLVADRVVVCPGAYAARLLPGFLPGRLTTQRRVLAWTSPDPSQRAALAAMPVWGGMIPGGFFYGFPYNEEGHVGCKIACHTLTTWDRVRLGDEEALRRPVDPETVDREIHEGDLAPLRNFIAEYMPAAAGPFSASTVCMYGCTPNWDFIIDRHPADTRVTVAAGFSGHGFKFAPAIARIVADYAEAKLEPGALAVFSRERHMEYSASTT